MVKNVELDQLSNVPSGELQPSDYERLARILVEAIPSDRLQMWSGKVMAYLASETARSC